MIAISEHAADRLWRWFALGLAALTLVVLLPRLGAQNRGAGAYFIPGDPKAGMQAFFDKGCARCHAVLGEGGRTAPDLARGHANLLSAAELVAAMWNHAPAMWEKMTLERLTLPEFSVGEMTDLFAFLYSVRSLDEPGDPERGRRLLDEMKCLQCHAITRRGGRVGPSLEKWVNYRNPVSWIQAMWNHALPMQAAMAQRGLEWPEFRDGDMADLIAYLRTLASNPGKRIYLRQADPGAGRRLYRTKGCIVCHAIRGVGGNRAPDFGRDTFPRTLGQFAALMWNHTPAMAKSMETQRVPAPRFSNQEMADLIAFLFTQRYFEVAGNAARGRQWFKNKGCAACHTGDSIANQGPDLAAWRGRASPVDLAAALWNHGPLMLESMRQQHVSWPRFRPGEIADLMEMLSQGQSSQNKAGGN